MFLGNTCRYKLVNNVEICLQSSMLLTAMLSSIAKIEMKSSKLISCETWQSKIQKNIYGLYSDWTNISI